MGCLRLDILEKNDTPLRAVSKNATPEKARVERFFTIKKLHVNYYPGGMQQPGRCYNSDQYRYSFNRGSEKDDEIYGSGNAYTDLFWEYDPRLLRRWNLDPVPMPWESPYETFANNPVVYNDPLGMTPPWLARIVQKIKIAYSKVTGRTLPVETWHNKHLGGTRRYANRGKGGGDSGNPSSSGNDAGDPSGNKGNGSGNPPNNGGSEGGSSSYRIPSVQMQPIPSLTPSLPDIPEVPDIPEIQPVLPPVVRVPAVISMPIPFKQSSDIPANVGQLQGQLQGLVALLKNNPGASVLILGNVFNPGLVQGNGQAALNQKNVFLDGNVTTARALMNARARAIANQLIMMGVSPTQVLFGPGSVRNTAKGLNVDFNIRGPH